MFERVLQSEEQPRICALAMRALEHGLQHLNKFMPLEVLSSASQNFGRDAASILGFVTSLVRHCRRIPLSMRHSTSHDRLDLTRGD